MADASIWDPGSNTALVNSQGSELPEIVTIASNGQQDFTIASFTYVPNTHSLRVLLNGVEQNLGLDFTEVGTGSTYNQFHWLTTDLKTTDTLKVVGVVGSVNTQAAATSATLAAASAAAALASQNSASTSATTATTQAGIATTQATAASASATAAAGSATTAGTAATNATASATAAATSATSASTSATAASGSATTASNAATTATTQATAAGTSATNAAASASAASTSATNAATSATTATTQAGNASTSATNAGTSATNAAASATAAAASAASISPVKEDALTCFYSAAASSGFQDLYRAGFKPSWFNQQWGGAQWGMLPDGSFGSVATGSIEDNTTEAFGNAVGYYYVSQGFKVSESITNPTIWLKLYKVGNPANLGVYIYSDNGSGSPNAQIGGSSGGISAKLITSKSDGEWYAFNPTPGTLTAGTQYHIVITNSSTDVSNYFVCRATNTRKYPNGIHNYATVVPTWSQATTYALCFLVQNTSATSILQSGGMFDYKLSFNSGTPVNQSRAVATELSNFFDGRTGTVLYRGTYAASSGVWEYSYGVDHDKIFVYVDASGYAGVYLRTAAGVNYQVTSTTVVTSGNHDIGVKFRCAGDGADYLALYVDGVSVGTPLTAQTFVMNKEFAKLGTARLGEFIAIPTWTQDMQMTSLPSAQGWTFGGTGTEANCFSIQNNKLYQNKNGIGASEYPQYFKTVSLNNATGWTITAKLRVPASSGSTVYPGCWILVQDGSKRIDLTIQENFLQVSGQGGSTMDATIQGDFKSQEHVFVLCGKGSDYYLLIDNKFVFDGTGKSISATGTNQIVFGDGSSTSGENADAIWSYVKYYQGGMILPTASSGSCSEFAHWSADKSSYLPYAWNSGTPVSLKQICGIPRNYQYEAVTQKEVRYKINYSTTSAALSPIPDMQCFVLGDNLIGDLLISMSMSGANYALATVLFDGANTTAGVRPQATFGTTSGVTTPFTVTNERKVGLGLHKVDACYGINGGTLTADMYSNGILRVSAEA